MKRTCLRIVLMLSLFLCASLAVHAQEITPQAVMSAFSLSDAEKIASYCAPNVEFSISGNSKVLKQEEVHAALSDFFAKLTISSLKMIHQGSQNSATFCILTFSDSNGKAYRVYVLIRLINNQKYIQQFRIDLIDD